jgi:hypothetical protein
MDAMDIARRLAQGGRIHELTGRSGRTFRLFAPSGVAILRVYRTIALQRRERRALETLQGVTGLPDVYEWGGENDLAWGLFADAGSWNLATLPSNSAACRRAGGILRALHERGPSGLSNLVGGMDRAWLASEYRSVFTRLERYRRRVGVTTDLLERALAFDPPIGGPPTACHTNPRPDRLLVSDEGRVTLIDWAWATAAPAEWDYSLAVWSLRMQASEAAVDALIEGYGRTMPDPVMRSWVAFHAASQLLLEAETHDGRLDRLAPVVDALAEAVSD